MKIIPKESEKFFDKDVLLVTKTDLKGVITYANKEFLKIVGADTPMILNKPHNIIRHPDMPRIIFKMLWDYLKNGKEIHAYVKNLCFDGSYYWVFANVTPSIFEDKVIGYHSARRNPEKRVLDEVIRPLYKKLLVAEAQGGIEASEKILSEILKSEGVEYDEFILTC